MSRDLRSLLRGLTQTRRRGPGLDLKPATAYEAQTRQMVDDLKADLAEIRLRLNGLLFLVAGAFVVDVVLRVTR